MIIGSSCLQQQSSGGGKRLKATDDTEPRHRKPETYEHIIEDLLDWSLLMPHASTVLGLARELDRINIEQHRFDNSNDSENKETLSTRLNEGDKGSARVQGKRIKRRRILPPICFKPEVATFSANDTYTPMLVEETHTQDYCARIYSCYSGDKNNEVYDWIETSREECRDSESQPGLTGAFIIPIMLPNDDWNVIEKQQPRKNGWEDDTLKARERLIRRVIHEAYDAYVRMQGLDKENGSVFSTEQEDSEEFVEQFLVAQYEQEKKLYEKTHF